ncbi:type II toxin-antitoxin system ParD family antitoxin [Nocardia sp. NBC_01388]|uniref:type II toxin-antitoxin system ParD family antitoxin n=1 Tax=Nocardia sp. NBC_01388 TaxID=2903596 RepID=UPI003864DD87
MEKHGSPGVDDRETRLRALQEALEVAERSGPSTPFDFDIFLAAAAARRSARRCGDRAECLALINDPYRPPRSSGR